MIINNMGLRALGAKGNPEIDSITFERGIPKPINREGDLKYLACEMCESVNTHWGLAKDFNFKAPKRLIEELCECRKVGANFLLNVGLDANGNIPLYTRVIMSIIGEWLKMYGEAIYNDRPYWYSDKTRNFALKSYDCKHIYLFCFDLCRRGSADVTY